ncbi:MAG: autotransporter outer membrane beta-barrel domain-containing protein [Pseudomonadota bacterium]|nr:autotransporter outer membrane beta-barrel domain-containing protein [Pseudomonadota bacterium]
MNQFLKAAALAALTVGAVSAQANEVYGAVGLTGVTVGYAYPINDSFTVRGDITGGYGFKRNDRISGVDYSAKLAAHRVGAYGDWFPAGNQFRLTGGLAFNDNALKLRSRAAANSTTTINGKDVDLTGHYLNVDAEYPKVAPYIGIGWGHRKSDSKGWSFNADLGVMIGKYKLKNIQQNIVGTQGVEQADLDAEIAKVQKDLNKLRVFPVLSVGVSYRF